MSKSFNENSRVKIPAIVHLTRLNYEYISLQQIEQQIDSETNIYKESFRAALNQINGIKLSDKDIDSIISDLKNLLDADDLGRSFYEKFLTGIAFAGESIRLIDFESLEKNIFEVMTEVPYRNGADSFRPDITIFVNGLPLAFIEVKIPDNKQGIQAEHRRMSERFSQEKYRRFANITQLMIFSNNSEYDDEEIFVTDIQRAGSTSTTGKLSITVINIQKFSDESVATEPKFNVNVQRIYFIDEAHHGYKWDGS